MDEDLRRQDEQKLEQMLLEGIRSERGMFCPAHRIDLFFTILQRKLFNSIPLSARQHYKQHEHSRSGGSKGGMSGVFIPLVRQPPDRPAPHQRRTT